MTTTQMNFFNLYRQVVRSTVPKQVVNIFNSGYNNNVEEGTRDR